TCCYVHPRELSASGTFRVCSIIGDVRRNRQHIISVANLGHWRRDAGHWRSISPDAAKSAASRLTGKHTLTGFGARLGQLRSRWLLSVGPRRMWKEFALELSFPSSRLFS